MSKKENDIERVRQADLEDSLDPSDALISPEIPTGVDRRDFLIRSAVVGAAAVMTGRTVLAVERTEQAVETIPHFAQKPAPAQAPALSADLNVVKKGQGPVMTTLEEFYKVGPGPSSSHTIGPMRIPYDF